MDQVVALPAAAVSAAHPVAGRAKLVRMVRAVKLGGPPNNAERAIVPMNLAVQRPARRVVRVSISIRSSA